jgi:hypothetical protein
MCSSLLANPCKRLLQLALNRAPSHEALSLRRVQKVGERDRLQHVHVTLICDRSSQVELGAILQGAVLEFVAIETGDPKGAGTSAEIKVAAPNRAQLLLVPLDDFFLFFLCTA